VPLDDSRAHGSRSQQVDLIAQLVQLSDRVKAVETDAEQRALFSQNVNKLLTQLTMTVEAHETQIDEFRKATTQIARIAQVLEGAFGQTGLVSQVAEIQKNVSAMGVKLTQIEAQIEAKLPALADEETVSVEKADTLMGIKKDVVVSALVKVIIALCALLSAAHLGSRFGGAPEPAPDAKVAPAAPSK